MTGKGLRAYNNPPTKEKRRKERKVMWIESYNMKDDKLDMMLMIDMKDDKLGFWGKQWKAMCSIVEKFLE